MTAPVRTENGKNVSKTLGLTLELLDLDRETEWQQQMIIDKFETLHVRESRS